MIAFSRAFDLTGTKREARKGSGDPCPMLKSTTPPPVLPSPGQGESLSRRQPPCPESKRSRAPSRRDLERVSSTYGFVPSTLKSGIPGDGTFRRSSTPMSTSAHRLRAEASSTHTRMRSPTALSDVPQAGQIATSASKSFGSCCDSTAQLGQFRGIGFLNFTIDPSYCRLPRSFRGVLCNRLF